MERPRLRHVQDAALTLTRYWIEEVHYAAGASSSVSGPVEVKASRPTVLENPQDALQYFVRLRVKATRGEQSFDITLSGLFHLAAQVDDVQPSQLVKYNGPAILYGLIRALAATLTGASDSGRFELPTLSVVDMVDG